MIERLHRTPEDAHEIHDEELMRQENALNARDTIQVAENQLNEKITPEHAQEIAERVEQMPEYQLYQKQTIRFDTLESLLSDYDNGPGKNAENADEVRENLNDSIESVENASKIYFDWLVKIDHLHTRRSLRMEKREIAEESARLDRLRRLAHNGLMTNLCGLRRLIEKHFPENRKHGLEAREKTFSLAELADENRADIGLWAYRSVAGSRFEKIRQQALTVLEKEKTA